MRILVTGAKGMVGTALVNNLRTIQDGRNKPRPNIKIEEIYEYDLENNKFIPYFAYGEKTTSQSQFSEKTITNIELIMKLFI